MFITIDLILILSNYIWDYSRFAKYGKHVINLMLKYNNLLKINVIMESIIIYRQYESHSIDICSKIVKTIYNREGDFIDHRLLINNTLFMLDFCNYSMKCVNSSLLKDMLKYHCVRELNLRGSDGTYPLHSDNPGGYKEMSLYKFLINIKEVNQSIHNQKMKINMRNYYLLLRYILDCALYEIVHYNFKSVKEFKKSVKDIKHEFSILEPKTSWGVRGGVYSITERLMHNLIDEKLEHYDEIDLACKLYTL